MLQLDLKKLDHVDCQTSSTGDGNSRIVVGLKHLADTPMCDEVAFRGPSITRHDHPTLVAEGKHSGGLGRRRGCGAFRNGENRARPYDFQEITEASAGYRDVEGQRPHRSFDHWPPFWT